MGICFEWEGGEGARAARLTAGTGRQAYTVMAGISAAGDKLAPFFILKGKLFSSVHKPVEPGV